VRKMMVVAERVKHTFIKDKSRTFNTARIEALELDNLVDTALASMVSADARKESRGSHDRSDFHERDDVNWMKHTLAWKRPGEGVQIDYRPVHKYTMSKDIEYIEPKARVY
jgi:succinate dehydrogenase / fumarate reductase flavoprotein subunit